MLSCKLADRDMLNDWLRLCDCEWKALNDSFKLAERDIERECDTLMLSCRLADLLILRDWLRDCDRDALML